MRVTSCERSVSKCSQSRLTVKYVELCSRNLHIQIFLSIPISSQIISYEIWVQGKEQARQTSQVIIAALIKFIKFRKKFSFTGSKVCEHDDDEDAALGAMQFIQTIDLLFIHSSQAEYRFQ